MPVVTSAGISGTHDEAKVKAPGVVTGRYGTVGQVYYVTEDFWPHNTTLFVKDFKGNDPQFASYLLRTINFLSCSDKSGVPGVNRNHLHLIKVRVPSPHQQRAIASVLGALDDKIDLNRRMNVTLEALAQAIFKSWFVDAAAIKLPKGWRAGTLGELVELRADRVEATPAKDKERYIALEDMPSKSIDLSNHQLGSAVNSSIIRFQAGDILFGSMRPYFHKVGLASFDGITRTTTFVLRPKQDCLRHFALFYFFSNEVVEFATTASVGTTIPYVKWDSLGRYKIVLPPESLLEEFENAVAPLVQLIARNGDESRTLAELRDALLPKLLSGELRVPVK